MRRYLLLAAAASALVPLAAHAQTIAPGAAEDSVFDGDYLIVGVGGVYEPSYEGSNDYIIYPVPLVQGQLRGIGISARQGGVALDFIPDGKDAKIGFQLGPVATYSGNRNSLIKDPVVRAAGKLGSDIAVGVNAGISTYKVLDAYDSLSAGVDVKWDVHGPKGGMTLTPSLSYITPLSKAAIVTLGVSAKHVDRDYADYYYSVSPGQSAASGLPRFQARSGWANVGGTVLAAYDLDGNLLNGGASIFALGSYTRLLDDARRTPYTSLRGSADQWMLGAGVAYTF